METLRVKLESISNVIHNVLQPMHNLNDDSLIALNLNMPKHKLRRPDIESSVISNW